jgi:uncharacterized protein
LSVELRPLGVHCNLQCTYCYQQPERDAGNVTALYDLEAMKTAVKAEGGPFVLFGGEPLLLPIADLESLWSFGLSEFGGNSIQTNGALIDDDHIRLFRRYEVKVGISIDGPGALNDARWQGTLARTRAATAATEQAIARLCEERMAPGLIVTLHRGNAAAGALPPMYDWIRSLATAGVRRARLHLLEVESEAVRRKYALSTEENIAAMLGFKALEAELQSLRFDMFGEMRSLLLGRDRGTSCIWNACDPYTTEAVRGVEGFGQRSNCGRTNKDGIEFVKAGRPGFERYLALHATPQSAGGCGDCRFFMMCKGQCPGTALGGDWRNRTEHCEVLKALYGAIEAELVAEGHQPLSLHAQREALEKMMLRTWAAGSNAHLSDQVPNVESAGQTWRTSLRQLRQELSTRGNDARSHPVC